MSFWKDFKRILLALTCLMIVSSFAAGVTVTVKAQPLFTLWAVVSDDLCLEHPEYLDILYIIQIGLENIGIDLQIVLPEPSAAFEDTWNGASIVITDYVLATWNVSGDADGDGTWEYGVDGWDLTIGEVQLWNLTGLENLVIETPPSGYNIMPWMNPQADELYYLAMETPDSELRREYMCEWQEEFMHDPPMIILYYPWDSMNASVPIWMNLNNPILSNRYVRQAKAHGIPYPTIFEILLGWGVYGTRGTTLIPPTMYEFNSTLEPYEYNLTKAQMYMDMWYYSQVGTDYTLGPVGDADFSGFVELWDFFIWRENRGTTSADWTFLPGRDIDPDFDNNDYVSGIGDVNGDGKVDASDLVELNKAYGSELGDPNWEPGCDFNGDKRVDASDLFDLSKNYGETNIDFILWQQNAFNEYPFPGAR